MEIVDFLILDIDMLHGDVIILHLHRFSLCLWYCL